MNLLFGIIFLLSSFLLLCSAPENFLPALLDGAGKAATLCLSLIATYSIWMGLMKIWEDCGFAKGVSKLLKPAARKLLKTDDDAALSAVCMNLSVNMLGISGAATPYGVRAAQLLDKTDNAEYSSAMFFVLNATSLQLLPTSLVSVRVALHSAAPTDIILPTLFSTLFSTVLGILLTMIFIPSKKRGAQKRKCPWGKRKMTGAGTQ